MLSIGLLVALTAGVGPYGLYYELREPPQPAGTVLVLHGGGWLRTGADDTRYESGQAERLTRYGWRTVNADYRPGRRSVADALAWTDWIRERWRGPVCVFGRSAGAHLALMAAARRRVECVIGHGPITDLRNVKGTLEARELRRDYVRPVFGRQLRRYSPIRRPARPDTRVLMATSAGDRYAACRRQLVPYERARPASRTRCLSRGRTPFIHSGVSERAAARQAALEGALLERVARCQDGCRSAVEGPALSAFVAWL